MLLNRAGQEVALTLKGGRVITVRTLRDETPARYRDWVERNLHWIHKQSKGRVGYVHIPDMGPPGYAEFHRAYLTEVDREALVIDVRNNGGGHVSQLILEKLARRRVGFDVNRWGEPMPYPGDSPAGPLVALTNESAGSDGDIFSHCFKLFKLGPLVGRRTWGGVIGIWPRHHLVDGSMTTQPEFSFWFRDVGFGVENYGTDPDVEVDLLPQDVARGRDPQLEKALEIVLGLLKKHRPLRPDLKNRPNLALPR
jgi:tricorn protease